MTAIHITALRHSAFYTPLLVTIAGGFLKKAGLEPIYRPASPSRPVVDCLRNGECHVSQSAVATSFADLEEGRVPDIVHFARINSRDGFFLANRHPQPGFTWTDLKGKSVLVDHFFQPLAMFRFALHRNGITLDDIDVIDAGDVTAIEKAFRDGQGEYVHLQGPAPQQLEQDGLAHVVASVGDPVGPVAFSSLCATRLWLETDMARSFMAAYREALAFTVEAPAEELAAIEQGAGFFVEIDRAVLVRTIDAYKSLGTWRTDPIIPESEFERLLDVFQYSNVITRRHDYNSVVVMPPDV
jgi:NitT/TauT family transport system substrate-binding protein